MESNNDVQLPFISQPGKKEAVNCGGGTNCTVKVDNSSQSHYLQNGYSMPSQLSLGSPGMTVGCSPYKNLLVWKIHGICCREAQWSVWARPLG